MCRGYSQRALHGAGFPLAATPRLGNRGRGNRPMNDKPVPLTAEGRAQMEAEYEHLVKVRRLEIAAQIGAAADDGDLSENAAYDHAKEEQALLEGRIAALEHFRRNAVLI